MPDSNPDRSPNTAPDSTPPELSPLLPAAGPINATSSHIHMVSKAWQYNTACRRFDKNGVRSGAARRLGPERGGSLVSRGAKASTPRDHAGANVLAEWLAPSNSGVYGSCSFASHYACSVCIGIVREVTGSTLRLDSAAVRVLAHPLRSRLLSALRRDGASTATALAQSLGTNTGATSYHLRKLASVGLIVDTGEGEGRRREWRAASRSHSWDPSDFAADEDATTALNWLMRDYLAHLVTHYQDWLDVEDAWPAPWRDASSLDDESLKLTAEQLATLRTDIRDVIDRYRDLDPEPGARPVAIHHVAYPRDLRPSE